MVSFAQAYSRQKSKEKNYEYNQIREDIEILESIPKENVSIDVKNIISELKTKENIFVKEKLRVLC